MYPRPTESLGRDREWEGTGGSGHGHGQFLAERARRDKANKENESAASHPTPPPSLCPAPPQRPPLRRALDAANTAIIGATLDLAGKQHYVLRARVH